MFGKVLTGTIVAGVATGAILHKMYGSKNSQASTVTSNSMPTGLSKDDQNTIRFITGARKTLFAVLVGGTSGAAAGAGIGVLVGRVLFTNNPSIDALGGGIDILGKVLMVIVLGGVGTGYGSVTGATYSFLNYIRG